MSRFICLLLLLSGLPCYAQSKSNLLPMYGRVPKTQDQLKADLAFLATADSLFKKDRHKASRYYAERGWDYFYQSIVDTAMFRFNQAWLLDSTNANVFWGYGLVAGVQGDFDQSIAFLERSRKMQNENDNLIVDLALSYLKRYTVKAKKEDQANAEKLLNEAVQLNAKNPYALYNLALLADSQKDYAKAWDYIHRVRQVNEKVIVMDFVKQLKRKMPDPIGFYK